MSVVFLVVFAVLLILVLLLILILLVLLILLLVLALLILTVLILVVFHCFKTPCRKAEKFARSFDRKLSIPAARHDYSAEHISAVNFRLDLGFGFQHKNKINKAQHSAYYPPHI